jgi:hypothetical protein
MSDAPDCKASALTFQRDPLAGWRRTVRSSLSGPGIPPQTTLGYHKHSGFTRPADRGLRRQFQVAPEKLVAGRRPEQDGTACRGGSGDLPRNATVRLIFEGAPFKYRRSSEPRARH